MVTSHEDRHSTIVDEEVVPGSNGTFTLINTPVLGSVKVFGLGSRLIEGTDYTIVDKVITTINFYTTGEIVADYRK